MTFQRTHVCRLALQVALTAAVALAPVLLPAVHADETAVASAATVTQTFGSLCSRQLPGCQRCQWVRRPDLGHPRGLLQKRVQEEAPVADTQVAVQGQANINSSKSTRTFRKTYVCVQCQPGWVLAGTGNLNDERSRYCVPEGTQPQNSTTVNTCANNCGRRGLKDAATNKRCFCDFWCNLYDDCCGGMNEAAAAAKDAACPALAPVADLSVTGICSAPPGLLGGDAQCGSYRPGGCWCDQYCSAAGDCCEDCPAACGTGTCVAPQHTTRTAAPAAAAGLRGRCGTASKRNQHKQLGDVSAAAFTQDLEARIQTCQNNVTGTNLATPIKTVPVVLVSSNTATAQAQYSPRKAHLLVKLLNDAYARAGFKFHLAHQTTFSFTNISDVVGSTTCYQEGNFIGASKCNRCRAYRTAPKQLQRRDVLHLYMAAEASGDFVGFATFPWYYYGQNPDNAAATKDTCMDGVYSKIFPAEDPADWEAAVRQDVAVVIHEIGHWLGLHHTWYQGMENPPSDEEQCAQQTGAAYADWNLQNAFLTDGVRDTPPQLLDRQDGNGKAIVFLCDNSTGRFDPNDPLMQPQALACNGLGKTKGKYFNNFYNVMSYSELRCDNWNLPRHKTFTAGQIARMHCIWRCYRQNECDNGKFPYNP